MQACKVARKKYTLCYQNSILFFLLSSWPIKLKDMRSSREEFLKCLSILNPKDYFPPSCEIYEQWKLNIKLFYILFFILQHRYIIQHAESTQQHFMRPSQRNIISRRMISILTKHAALIELLSQRKYMTNCERNEYVLADIRHSDMGLFIRVPGCGSRMFHWLLLACLMTCERRHNNK